MIQLFSLVKDFFHLGPRGYIRQRLKLPLIKFIHDTISLYKTRTKSGVNSIKEILIRGTIIALITSVLVWLSILMYMAFYYVYVPSVRHERPVHLKFKPCGATYDCQIERGMCSFPSAYVQLTSKQQLLMMGQPYKIHLDLEMPESPANRELGMFMVCVDFRANDGKTLANSCRSAMLHYKSNLLDTLYKLAFIPFFIFGSTEEKQTVHVELFSDYKESEYKPVTDIYVEIQSRHIEIYSAKFSVNAEFSGLRYVMFNWPVFSAALGITANLFFIALSCLMSWYQIINSEEYLKYIESKEKIELIDSDKFVNGDRSTLRTVKQLICHPYYMAFKVILAYQKLVAFLDRYPLKKEYTDPSNKELMCSRCKRFTKCQKHKMFACREYSDSSYVEEDESPDLRRRREAIEEIKNVTGGF